MLSTGARAFYNCEVETLDLVQTVKGSKDLQEALRAAALQPCLAGEYASGVVAASLDDMRGCLVQLFSHKLANYAVATLFEVAGVQARTSMIAEIQPSTHIRSFSVAPATLNISKSGVVFRER